MPSQLPTRKLGKNGPEVTALGFGLMGLSAFYGPPKSDEERLALLDHVYEAGCLHWDSADGMKRPQSTNPLNPPLALLLDESSLEPKLTIPL